MKNLIYISAILILTSCYNWKRAFVLPTKESDKNKYANVNQTDSININPDNFFYVRQEEYWDTLNVNYNATSKSYTTESSARLYKSIHVDSTNSSTFIVEENYLYLENYSDVTKNSGRIVHFKTAPFWGDGKTPKHTKNKKRIHSSELRSYFSSKDTINLSTSVITEFGFWRRDKNGTYHLLMKNAFGSFQIVATDNGGKEMVYKKISHPNTDNNIRNASNNDITIQVKEVMNVQGKDGLIYYRNVTDKFNTQRIVTTTYQTKEKDTIHTSIQSIHLGTKKKRFSKKTVLVNYLKTKDGKTLYARKKHRVFKIDDQEVKKFKENYKFLSKKERNSN